MYIEVDDISNFWVKIIFSFIHLSWVYTVTLLYLYHQTSSHSVYKGNLKENILKGNPSGTDYTRSTVEK